MRPGPDRQPVQAFPFGQAQSIIQPLFGHELAVGPGLHHFSMAHDQDLVGVFGRGQPVGHNQGGPALEQMGQGFLDFFLGKGIHVGGGLVQADEIRVSRQGPGHGDELALPRGKGCLGSPKPGVSPLGQAAGQVRQLGGL